jgi:hypothetical protein
MPVPKQLPHVTIVRTGYPDFRKAIFQQQPQQKSGVLTVGFLLPSSLSLDLRCIANLGAQQKLPRSASKKCPRPGTRFRNQFEVVRSLSRKKDNAHPVWSKKSSDPLPHARTSLRAQVHDKSGSVDPLLGLEPCTRRRLPPDLSG